MDKVEVVAGNGLLHRRAFLRGGALMAAAVTGYVTTKAARAEPLADAPWSREMGSATPPVQTPSRFEKQVVRTRSNPNNEPRNSHARTPHQSLQGTVTPASLHFTVNHAAIPETAHA